MPDQKTVYIKTVSSPNIYNYQMTFKDSFSWSNFFKPGIDFGPINGDDVYYWSERSACAALGLQA